MLTLNKNKWSPSGTDHFIPKQMATSTNTRLGEPQASLYTLGRRKIFLLLGTNTHILDNPGYILNTTDKTNL